MPGPFSRKLSLIAVAMAAAIAAIAGIYSRATHLPHPDRASQTQLYRWLVQRDLSAEPAELQESLVDRLETQFDAGTIEPASLGRTKLSTKHRTQLAANIDLLQREWFFSRCENYQRVATENRMAFLSDKIQMIEQWSRFSIDQAPGAPPAEETSSLALFFDRIEDWLATSKGSRREAATQAVRDGLITWLATSDLTQQSLDTRSDLAVRIADYLDQSDTQLQSSMHFVGDQFRDQLVINGKLLLEAWMHERADRLAQLDQSEQTAFMDQQIDRFLNWDLMKFLMKSAQGETVPNNAATMKELAGLTSDWLARADPDRRPRLKFLIDNLQQRLMWRQLRAMMRGVE